MSNSRPRVLFFGMEGAFSTPVFLALLEHDLDICALVLPGSSLAEKSAPVIQRREPPASRRVQIPLLSANPSLLQLVHAQEIPVWEVQRLSHPQTISTLSAYQADFLCVACFSQRIPDVLCALPRLAALNVHPSLLPANRGPVPLFWTFREGQSMTGVTVHTLEASLDSGDIYAQSAFPVPDGISYNQLEILAAQKGGELLVQTLEQLAQGNAVCVPQDEAKSSYHSFPKVEDVVVQAELWHAQHIYNFVEGVGHWYGGVLIHAGEYVLSSMHALSYSTLSHRGSTSAPPLDAPIDALKPFIYQEGVAWIRCLDGWVQANVEIYQN